MYSNEYTPTDAWSGVPASEGAGIDMAHQWVAQAGSIPPNPFLQKALQLAMSCYGDNNIWLVNAKPGVARVLESAHCASINMKPFFAAEPLPAPVTKP
jgi:hypothetical protein